MIFNDVAYYVANPVNPGLRSVLRSDSDPTFGALFETIMNSVRKYSVLMLILIFSISIDTKSLNRVKGHTETISRSKNQQKQAIERLILKWRGGKALGYDRPKSEILIEGIVSSRMRLDLQGIETSDKHTFERYVGSPILEFLETVYEVYHVYRILRLA